jgi:drug/metabolite transporter (DMT)-like permease
MNFIGEIAGVMTSLFYAINAVVITKATGKTGPVITNRARITFALLYLVIINLILFRQPLPFNSGSDHWVWLSLSGVIGLALGDTFLFQSYTLVGARIGALLLSLSTVIAGSMVTPWRNSPRRTNTGDLACIDRYYLGDVRTQQWQRPGRSSCDPRCDFWDSFGDL